MKWFFILKKENPINFIQLLFLDKKNIIQRHFQNRIFCILQFLDKNVNLKY